MKKIIVVVLGFFVIGLASAGVYVYLNSRSSHDFSTVLPAEPVFYLELKDLGQRWDSLSRTKLYQDFKKIEFNKFSPASSEASADEFWTEDNVRMLRALFGEKLAIAVYSNKSLSSEAAPNPPRSVTEAFSNILLITQIAPEVAVSEPLLKIWGRSNKDIRIRTERYNGQEINFIEDPKSQLSLGYTRFGNILVAGVGAKPAQAAIDVSLKKIKSLSSDRKFQALATKKRDPQGHTFGFFDIQSFLPMLKEQFSGLTGNDQEREVFYKQLEEQSRQLQGVQGLVISAKPDVVLNWKADLLFDPSALSSDFRSLYTCPPQENKAAGFVPWNAMVYQWSTCLDFAQIWKQYKDGVAQQSAAMGQDADISGMIALYEQMLGLSIDRDVLPVFGQEFGFYLTDLNLSGTVPIPKFVMFLETTGTEKFETLLGKLLALQPLLQLQEETYQSRLIRFFPIPMMEGLAISYTYIDQYLLLSSNIDVLKASIDASQDHSRSVMIHSALRANPGPKNSVFLIQTDQFLRTAQELVEWGESADRRNQVQREAFLAGIQKNLADLRARSEQLRNEVAGHEAKLAELESAVFDPAVDPVIQKADLNKKIESAKSEILANQDKEAALSDQIASFQSRAPVMNTNQTLVNEIAKPMLEALMNIRYVLIMSVNGPGAVGSVLQADIR